MATNFDFNGKVIAITGAASGIGLALAELLALRGAKVSLADVQEKLLQEAAARLEKAGGQVLATVVNVADSQQVNDWIQKTVDKWGNLDGAANLAGVIPKTINIDRVEELKDTDWAFVMSINLTGVMYCMRAQIPNMNVKGSIVNAASVAGMMGFAKNAAYTASKHAVIGLSRSAAKEVGDRGMRVNCIAPYVNPEELSPSTVPGC